MITSIFVFLFNTEIILPVLIEQKANQRRLVKNRISQIYILKLFGQMMKKIVY